MGYDWVLFLTASTGDVAEFMVGCILTYPSVKLILAAKLETAEWLVTPEKVVTPATLTLSKFV